MLSNTALVVFLGGWAIADMFFWFCYYRVSNELTDKRNHVNTLCKNIDLMVQAANTLIATLDTEITSLKEQLKTQEEIISEQKKIIAAQESMIAEQAIIIDSFKEENRVMKEYFLGKSTQEGSET